MNVVDVVIIAFTLFFAASGFTRGFLVGAASLAGFAAGAYLGTRLGPSMLSEGSESPYAPLFGLFGALAAGAIIAAGLEGLAQRVRVALIPAGLGFVDGALGAVLSAGLALGLAWVFGVIALQTPGARELRHDVQRSSILRRLNDALPSDTLLKALARFDPAPHVDGPEVDVKRPREKIVRDPDIQAISGSVVRVLGSACGLGVSGSGWIAPGGLVVTNAHVVAGQDDTVVQKAGSGPKLDATVVHFDTHDDLALLRVDGLEGTPLTLSPNILAGQAAAVLGFPLNGPYRVRAARVGTTRNVISQDAYGRGPTTRSITAFRGVVQPGNSGGPLVDGQGRVDATVFAKSTAGGPEGGYAVPLKVVKKALDAPHEKVGTGPCVG